MKPKFPFPAIAGFTPGDWTFVGHFSGMDVYLGRPDSPEGKRLRRVYETTTGIIRTRTNEFDQHGPRPCGLRNADAAYKMAWERLSDPSISPNAKATG